MSLTYGFYNGINHDRTYNAEQVSALFDGLINDGVFDSIGDIFATVPGDGLQVLVKSGKAWFNHTWTINDAPIPLTISTPDVTLARIDAVVLEVNHAQSVRANSIKIKTGMAATNPTKPAMTATEDIHQYPLAYVTVRAAATEIKAADIEINVGKSTCPFVTGIIRSTDIDDLFNQWEGQFDAWFENLKAQLTDDVVANLQKQIDEKLNIADKATDAEALAGTNNTHYMTPALTKKAVEGKIISSGKLAPLALIHPTSAMSSSRVFDFAIDDIAYYVSANVNTKAIAINWINLVTGKLGRSETTVSNIYSGRPDNIRVFKKSANEVYIVFQSSSSQSSILEVKISGAGTTFSFTSRGPFTIDDVVRVVGVANGYVIDLSGSTNKTITFRSITNPSTYYSVASSYILDLYNKDYLVYNGVIYACFQSNDGQYVVKASFNISTKATGIIYSPSNTSVTTTGVIDNDGQNFVVFVVNTSTKKIYYKRFSAADTTIPATYTDTGETTELFGNYADEFNMFKVKKNPLLKRTTAFYTLLTASALVIYSSQMTKLARLPFPNEPRITTIAPWDLKNMRGWGFVGETYLILDFSDAAAVCPLNAPYAFIECSPAYALGANDRLRLTPVVCGKTRAGTYYASTSEFRYGTATYSFDKKIFEVSGVTL